MIWTSMRVPIPMRLHDLAYRVPSPSIGRYKPAVCAVCIGSPRLLSAVGRVELGTTRHSFLAGTAGYIRPTL